jgi:hypothetical protein
MKFTITEIEGTEHTPFYNNPIKEDVTKKK